MAEENKLNQTPETTPAPSAEAPEKAPTTGELLGDVEHYDEEKDDWSTGYYGTGSRQQVTDDVFHKLEPGEEFTRLEKEPRKAQGEQKEVPSALPVSGLVRRPPLL